MNSKVKEPLFHIVKRDALPWYKSLGIRFLAILLALILCGIITTITTGINPLQVYQSIVLGAFGSVRKTWVTFQNIAILLLIALALTPAFKMKFWNIGGEGQVLIGGLAGLGFGVAAYQTWMQAYPHLAPECSFTDPNAIERLVDWLGMQMPSLFLATGFCTSREWEFLGLSMANWSTLFFAGIAGYAILLFRSKARA